MDWSENNSCIKCDKGGNVLVCSVNGCPLAVHERCLGYPANLDDAGSFRCPYCLYKQAVVETRKAREHALARKRALLIFMDGSGKDVGENGHNQPNSGGSNVNITSKSKSNNGGGIDQDFPVSEAERIRNAEESSAGYKAEVPSLMMNEENGNGAAEEKRVQEEERDSVEEEEQIQEEQREASVEEEEEQIQEEQREASVEEGEEIQEEEREASVEKEEPIQEEEHEASVEEEEEKEEVHEEEHEASVEEEEEEKEKVHEEEHEASVEEEEVQEEEHEASAEEEEEEKEEVHEEEHEASVEEEEEEEKEEVHEEEREASADEEEDIEEEESETSYASNSQDSSFTARAKRGLKRSKPVEKESKAARKLRKRDDKKKQASPAVSTPTRRSARGSSSAMGTGKILKKELISPRKSAKPKGTPTKP